MNWIFLSPHLDDIAFSCGGLAWELANDNHNVEIWNICAGDPPDGSLSPFARTMHESWGLGMDAVRIRREEDRKACQLMGVSPRYFNYLDCIYRVSAEGDFFYQSGTEIFGGLDPREETLIDALFQEMRRSLPEDVNLVVPLGIGNHVDHQLTRKAAHRLGRDLLYYADYPYAREEEGQEILGIMADSPEWRCEVFPISDQGLEIWFEGARSYGSQISTFWPDEQALKEEIRQFSGFLEGVKLWRTVENH
jgi:LmbE family N-acetylglucosaminyl deacetylase